MEHRQLGRSGFRVPVLSFGTATFGGRGWLGTWGTTQEDEARRLVDICLEAGVTLFDSANTYSDGRAEEVLGAAIRGRRDDLLVSTKLTFRWGQGPNDVGSSRSEIIQGCERALKRLGTDRIDLFILHGYDAMTPQDEVMTALDHLIRQGKILYSGCSNFSGWHLMKALTTADRLGVPRHVVHQAYYSLVGRDYEWELMPLGLEEGVGCMVWSPLGGGRLTGRLRQGETAPAGTRLAAGPENGPPVPEARLYRVLDTLHELARETGRTVAQVALAWVLGRPTVATVVIGARDEAQLRDNLGAVGWSLDAGQVARLDAASAVQRPYPYWHQAGFAERNPFPTG